MLKLVNVRWSNGQGQRLKMVKVGWSKPRSDSQGQIVKMVKVVKVGMLRWWGWSRIR